MHPLRLVTCAGDPEIRAEIARLHREGWPPFLLENPLVAERWGTLYDDFAAFQFVLVDENGTALACGNTIPIPWDGSVEGLPADIPEMLWRGAEARRHETTPSALFAIAALVDRRARGRGVSRLVLENMRAIGAAHGLRDLLAPVRPTGKADYPLTPFERYVEWRRDDGTPFDPWIRVHWRLGARPLAIARRALVIEGTPEEWHEWTGLSFPESGPYVVPGALQPVDFDLAWNRGVYEDPNYWMRHRIDVPHARDASHADVDEPQP